MQLDKLEYNTSNVIHAGYLTYQSKLFTDAQQFNLFQWTASGRIGTNGANAANLVAVVRELDDEEKSKKLLMEEKSAKAQLQRPNNATLMPAKWRISNQVIVHTAVQLHACFLFKPFLIEQKRS